ncbi:unnamed protein product [Thlaspi arvense]|uniref:Cyclic nucleotide-binding domain-containing protein n=1 Tax=Thlaspi arvense TaxID=13288 RepID=A0AAU9S3S3_THLAR|nr:unnamed protein product [Thlaspi arvense]
MINTQRNKFVRFTENEDLWTKTSRPSVTSVMKIVRRSLEKGSEKIKTFKQPLKFHPPKKKENKNKILRVMNPNDSYLQNWNKIFLLLCVVALAFDPLFFYIPVVNAEKFCLTLDTKLEAVACVFRSFIDAFYVVHMLFQFRTGFIAPSSRGFGRGELVENFKSIAIRYLCSYFVIDVLSILPIPQVVVLAIVPRMERPASLVTKELLKWVIFCQYVPRIARIYPLFKEVTRTSGLVTETAWAGAALNLFLYMLASHVFGSFWYLISIERKDRCWRETCANITGCNHMNLYCSPTGGVDNRDFLKGSCPLIDPEEITNSTVFNFGIFAEALQSGVVESRDFPKKFFYCFWWGLRNLSALGQNLKTSAFEGEIIFAIVICVSGLVLFALLIGNMQKYLQSTTVRVEEMRVKRRDAEQWMSHRMLPDDLRKRIRKYEQYKWQETRGVEEEALLSSLPKDLRKDIKRHLCLNLLKKVPWFKAMDDRLLDALCARLQTVLYTEKSYIVREGEPVEEMLFIMRGNLISATTYGGKTGFFNSVSLSAGDFCGDHLLTWALDPHTSHFPISSRTVQALTEVEGFILSADDLKFYSVQWQTWAACFIQAAWKRHCRRKLSRALREEEGKLQNTLENDDSGGNRLNLGAAIYASRFASHALRNLRANAAARNSRFPQMLSLLPQKPADPEFDARNLDRSSSTFLSVNVNFKNVRRGLKKIYGKMKTIEHWRKIVLSVCVVALAIDPMFLFIPVIDPHRFCSTLDKKLAAAVCVLRTFIDTFYVIHIVFYFITEVIAPRSQVSLKGEIVVPSKAKRRRRNLFYFIVDILSILPIPQRKSETIRDVQLKILQGGDSRSHSKTRTNYFTGDKGDTEMGYVLSIYTEKHPYLSNFQRSDKSVWYSSRNEVGWSDFKPFPLHASESCKSLLSLISVSYILSNTTTIVAAMKEIDGQVIGAFWYLSAIERKDKCWREACANTSGCNLKDLYCARGARDNSRFLNTSCPLIDPDQITNSTVFNFGMYIDALKSRVVESRDFPRKFFYCFWWGLRNLSALGQNLVTSNSVGEMIFAIIICVSGVLLFAVLIGNVQKYLQSTTIRVDEMEEKKRDTEKWMSYRVLPEYLKERIRGYEDYKWRETRGIEEDALLRSLPKDIRLETKRHLYMQLLKRAPWLNIMDDGWLLEALCDRVKSVFYSANSYIVRQGDPVEEILIVTKGKLISSTESHGWFNAVLLGAGDICGEQLFLILDPHTGSRLPRSNRTVKTHTDVEGFILLPDDVKFVASHFNRSQNMRLKHMFHSVEWQTWGACLIQAVWRAHCLRKTWGACLIQAAWRVHCLRKTQDQQTPQLSFGATLYVSRFVYKALRYRWGNTSGFSPSPPPVPHKPADPEFSKDEA